MRIWWQTYSTYRYDPLFEEFGRTLEVQCRRAARPDTEVYVTGVPTVVIDKANSVLVDRYKSVMQYHASQALNNMLKAEKQGYDAFIIGCSYDVGMDEGREMLDIPLVSIGHANLYMAAMLGEQFAIVTCHPFLAERYRQLIVRYGLQQKYLGGNYIYSVTIEELARALKDPAQLAEKYKLLVRRAVADGASVVIPFPDFIGQLFFKTGGLSQLDGATVLEPVGVALKIAEMLVDLKKLGIEVSRTLQVYGSPGKELLQKTFETYAPVYKIEF